MRRDNHSDNSSTPMLPPTVSPATPLSKSPRTVTLVT